mgnify:CR=1 FL=1|tara:strand:+ start:5560 stop:5853 length:294 start_codon:yes stop_codon:yes gene_type:complete
MKQFTQPEIFYEESQEGFTNGMPFMRVEKDQSIPGALFIAAASNFENKNTEQESEEDICEITMQMYVNSEVLKSTLAEEDYDAVREVLGLKPLKEVI